MGTGLLFAQKGKEKPFTLVIDPGHGGVDPGALGRSAKEKDINLKVSKLLAGMIEDEFPEVKIIFTRKTDVQIPLVKRATIANNANADLFISIHSNASKSRSANGCETFTLGAGSSAEAKAAAMYENEVILSEDNFEEIYKGFNPRSSESYIIFELMRGQDMEMSAELAQLVQNGMVRNSKLHNRGVSSAGFLVLHKTVMPKILVELGFISNREEEKFIASESGQKKLAKGIFEGFSEYYRLYGRQKGVESAKEKAKEKKPANTVNKKNKESVEKSGAPVFKVQIFATDKVLKKNDKRLKGVKAEYFKENGMYKYTYGESTDYNEIVKKRKEISKKFGQAFIIAFIDGKKTDTQKAIRMFKEKSKKR
ncbi:MAG: N-acetylmuramoyl-L-alanine amidase [Bacteroidaceae bacterium]|nr:N-acetylmuramoyl-L-alanine amidase [Bacteroidaceae bacterium]